MKSELPEKDFGEFKKHNLKIVKKRIASAFIKILSYEIVPLICRIGVFFILFPLLYPKIPHLSISTTTARALVKLSG